MKAMLFAVALMQLGRDVLCCCNRVRQDARLPAGFGILEGLDVREIVQEQAPKSNERVSQRLTARKGVLGAST
jgi:hypothetical protein